MRTTIYLYFLLHWLINKITYFPILFQFFSIVCFLFFHGLVSIISMVYFLFVMVCFLFFPWFGSNCFDGLLPIFYGLFPILSMVCFLFFPCFGSNCFDGLLPIFSMVWFLCSKFFFNGLVPVFLFVRCRRPLMLRFLLWGGNLGEEHG